jgi:putative ATP-dependent endonuclease of OLD family
LACGGFADEERVNSGRWACLKNALGNLLFRWKSSCTESEIIALVPENGLEQLIDDPTGEKSGDRRRTLAYRLGISEKDFDSLKAKSPDIRRLVIEAATGFAPNDQGLDESTKKTYRKHCQCWFKSHEGGEELLEKVFALGVWPQLKNQLLPFVNAVRTTLSLPEIQDLS